MGSDEHCEVIRERHCMDAWSHERHIKDTISQCLSLTCQVIRERHCMDAWSDERHSHSAIQCVSLITSRTLKWYRQCVYLVASRRHVPFTLYLLSLHVPWSDIDNVYIYSPRDVTYPSRHVPFTSCTLHTVSLITSCTLKWYRQCVHLLALRRHVPFTSRTLHTVSLITSRTLKWYRQCVYLLETSRTLHVTYPSLHVPFMSRTLHVTYPSLHIPFTSRTLHVTYPSLLVPCLTYTVSLITSRTLKWYRQCVVNVLIYNVL